MIAVVVAAVLATTTYIPASPPDDVQLLPVEPEAYTFDLAQAGYRNGRMPSERMMNLDGCVLERDAAYTMSLMLEQAARDGMRIVPQWCYRSLAEQQATYQRNCPVQEFVEPAYGPDGRQLVDESGAPVTVVQTKRVCSAPTASPSTSNHGWGRAVDFVVRGRTVSCGDPEYRWLLDNGPRFGWVAPAWARCNRVTAEPWHWEWGGLQVGLPLLSIQPNAPTEPPPGVE